MSEIDKLIKNFPSSDQVFSPLERTMIAIKWAKNKNIAVIE